MQRRFDTILDERGAPLVGVSIQVKNSGGATATVYEDNGITTKPNPLTTDDDGFFAYYAPDGVYSWVITYSATETRTITGVLHDDSSITDYWAIATGTGDAMIASVGGAALTNGFILGVRAAGANTVTAPTINVSGLGVRTIKGPAGVALPVGAYATNQEILLRYNLSTTSFEWLNRDYSLPLSGTSGVSLIGDGDRTLQAALLENPILCTSVKSGTTGTNTYALTPAHLPPGTTAAQSNGYRFRFTPDATCTGGAIQITCVGFSNSAEYLFAPDGRELATYFDVVKNRELTIEYRTGLYGFASTGFVIVDTATTLTQASIPHGSGKLQANGATTIAWTQEDGRGLMVWDPTSSAFRLSNFAVIQNSSLFTAVNYVEGVANQALAANTIYAVYYYDTGSGNTRYLDFWRMSIAAAEAWTPVINESGIYVKRSSAGGAGIDNSRTYLGMVYTAGSNIATSLGGANVLIRVQSHHKIWRFPYYTDTTTQSGFVTTSFVTQTTPRVEFVTEGITDTGLFMVFCNYANTTVGKTGEVRLKISGTTFSGAAFGPVYTTSAKLTTSTANGYLSAQVPYGTALPMGQFTVQPEIKVDGGSGTFELFISGTVAE